MNPLIRYQRIAEERSEKVVNSLINGRREQEPTIKTHTRPL